MKNFYRFAISSTLLGLLLVLAACGSTTNQLKPQETVTVNQSFQTQLSPMPTIPPYRCGSWASNNAPGAYSTITLYAKLTKNIVGVPGATARAVVHFQSGEVTLDQLPKSDQGGYVSFSLSLQGRQPSGVPATTDISFTVGKTTVSCSSAFFTPQ